MASRDLCHRLQRRAANLTELIWGMVGGTGAGRQDPAKDAPSLVPMMAKKQRGPNALHL